MILKNQLQNVSKKVIISIPILNKLYVKKHIAFTKLQYKFWDGIVTLNQEINDAMDKFLDECDKNDATYRKKIIEDIVYCNIRYGSTPIEFFLLGFNEFDDKKRNTMLTNYKKDRILLKKEGKEKLTLLRNKYMFYQRLGKYFKRDVCLVKTKDDYNNFISFVSSNKEFIAKPNTGRCAMGTKIYKINDNSNIDEYFNEILKQKKPYILEELIHQDIEMSMWNESSVNTIRINSFLKDEEIYILGPFMRTGRKGSIVDNAATGGIFAVIDVETGCLCTDGVDEKGNKYEVHPDSKIKYKGWMIPQWSKLIDLTKLIHSEMPDYRFIGWDFALSDKGWVLIEGDWTRFISEYADKKGIKNTFIDLMN